MSLQSYLAYNYIVHQKRKVKNALSVLNQHGWRDWDPAECLAPHNRDGLGRRILRAKAFALIMHDRILTDRSPTR
jgi:hypothetical protein